MSRTDFLKKLVRYILLIFMAVIVFALGNKVVSAAGCSVCPSRGICTGENDCDKFLKKKP